MTAFFTRLSLGFGVLAILVGLALAGFWLHDAFSHRATPSEARREHAAVLVAARPIASGALLRPEDLTWRDLGAAAAPAGSFTRDAPASALVVGSASRRSFGTGEVLVSNGLIRPDERDFLAATLAPSQRAVTLAVDPPQSASGLIRPGDRVDVILVQDLGDNSPARRSVADTVLHNARVLALGRTFGEARSAAAAASGVAIAAPAEAPRTITLEASPVNAQRLFMAEHLGGLQIALRALGDVDDGGGAGPTWAADVSNATGAATPHGGQAPPAVDRPAAPGHDTRLREPAAGVHIIRGSQAAHP